LALLMGNYLGPRGLYRGYTMALDTIGADVNELEVCCEIKRQEEDRFVYASAAWEHVLRQKRDLIVANGWFGGIYE
jgi:hypothetical protein